MIQKPISETAHVSSEADAEDNTMSQAMSEDIIEDNPMAGEELINDPESEETMIEEMLEHEEMISIHDFKEALHELVKLAVDKIVQKKKFLKKELQESKEFFHENNGPF